MGKRTSDFIALASIVGGAGLGLGLTSLLVENAVPDAADSSVRIRVVRPSIVERERRLNASADERVVHEALIVPPGQAKAELFYSREKMGFDREELERVMAQGGALRLDILNGGDLEGLYEALENLKALENLEGLEALEALGQLDALEGLDLGSDLTIDIVRSYDDERRRRRRRRRPRAAAEIPSFDTPGN